MVKCGLGIVTLSVTFLLQVKGKLILLASQHAGFKSQLVEFHQNLTQFYI